MVSGDKADGRMTEKWTRSAEVSEVISAADEPRPVLWTFERETPVGLNGGILARDSIVLGSPNDSSWKPDARGQERTFSLFYEDVPLRVENRNHCLRPR